MNHSQFSVLCSIVLAFMLLTVDTTNAADLQSPVDPDSTLELVRDDFQLADGPSWDGRGALYVPDVKAQKVFRYRPANNTWQEVIRGDIRYSASFISHERLILSANSVGQIHSHPLSALSQPADSVVECFASGNKPPRPNDLVVDDHGGIYYTLTSTNEVIYVGPDSQQSVLTTEVALPNGIILSPDQSTLYVAAYRQKKIQAITLSAPGVAQKLQHFATMDDGEAPGADGMSIDRAGNVYCAGASDIWIWAPNGQLLDRIACPQRPINCAFGDADMRTLYITGFGGLWKQRMLVSGRAPEPARNDVSGTKRPSTAIPENIHATTNLVYATVGTRKLLTDMFIPEGIGPFPAVVCVHGGGWLKGDKTKFRALGIELARRGYVTSVIEYRLGDEALFPAAIHDCYEAVRHLRRNAAEFHVDAGRIGVVGGSAGGHLAGLMATGSDTPALQSTHQSSPELSRVQAAVVMAGPMQIASGNVAERSIANPAESNSVRWIGGSFEERPDSYHLADAYEKISSATPPILFMRGEHDRPQTDEVSMTALKKAGVWTDQKIYKDGKHGCWNQLPWFTQMVGDMDDFFATHLK